MAAAAGGDKGTYRFVDDTHIRVESPTASAAVLEVHVAGDQLTMVEQGKGTASPVVLTRMK